MSARLSLRTEGGRARRRAGKAPDSCGARRVRASQPAHAQPRRRDSVGPAYRRASLTAISTPRSATPTRDTPSPCRSPSAASRAPRPHPGAACVAQSDERVARERRTGRETRTGGRESRERRAASLVSALAPTCRLASASRVRHGASPLAPPGIRACLRRDRRDPARRGRASHGRATGARKRCRG